MRIDSFLWGIFPLAALIPAASPAPAVASVGEPTREVRRVVVVIDEGAVPQPQLYTQLENQLRIERVRPPGPVHWNLVDLGADVVTVVYPHNRSYEVLPPPAPPAPPAPAVAPRAPAVPPALDPAASGLDAAQLAALPADLRERLLSAPAIAPDPSPASITGLAPASLGNVTAGRATAAETGFGSSGSAGGEGSPAMALGASSAARAIGPDFSRLPGPPHAASALPAAAGAPGADLPPPPGPTSTSGLPVPAEITALLHLPAAAPAPPTIELQPDEPRTIHGWVCQRYLLRGPGEEIEIWATAAGPFPFHRLLRERDARFGPPDPRDRWAQAVRAGGLFPFEVRTLGPASRTLYAVVSLRSEVLPAPAARELFTTPAGYHAIERPDFTRTR